MRTDHDDGRTPVWQPLERAAPGTITDRESLTVSPALSTRPSTARPVDARVGAEPNESCDQLRELVHEAAVLALRAVRTENSLDASIDAARPHLRAAGALAREHGVPAEQVILILKKVLRQQREVHGLSRGEIEIVLARVVTLCIKEYFASPGQS